MPFKFDVVLPLRIAQFVFAIIVMGLSGYVFHWYDHDTLTDPPTQINFLIVVPLFTFVSVLYLEVLSRFVPKVSHPIAHLAFSILNTLFYFSGFIALSVFLSKLLYCRGKVCAAARADAVFAAFAFCLWTGTSALLLVEMLKGKKTDEKAVKAMKVEKEHGAVATSAV